MTKKKPSKLDPFANQLEDWFDAGQTLRFAQEELGKRGVKASLNGLSTWWQGRQSSRLQERLLSQITSGARQTKEVEAAFGNSPAPEIETIIKLQRVLAMQFATASASNPEMTELAERSTRMVLEFAKLEAKRQDQALDERRVVLLEKRAAQADQAEAVVNGPLSAEEKQLKMKEIFGLQ